ncbi:MAG: hypothetical protein M1820_001960 [Bogoriella megaspora]|nr:MAG: hypothetical protein M1820_001960 [Bogoriella megaspora]
MLDPASSPSMGFDESYDISGRLLSIAWSMTILSFIFLFARIYTRSVIVRKVATDDYLLLLSWVLLALFAIVLQISCSYGLGKHVWNLDLQHRIRALKYSYVSQPVQILAVTAGRISFSITLIGLIGPHDQGKKYFIWFLVLGQIIINFSTVIIILAQCGSHPDALWNPITAKENGVKCWSPAVQTNYSYFQSSANVATDLVLTILPVWMIWGMQLKSALRITLVCLLGLSFFAMAATVVKTYEIRGLSERSDDTTATVPLYTWAVFEISFTIIAASIATLRPLYRRFFSSSISGPYPTGEAYKLSERRGGFSRKSRSASRQWPNHRRGGSDLMNITVAGAINGSQSSNEVDKIWAGQDYALSHTSGGSTSPADKRGTMRDDIDPYTHYKSGIMKTTVVEVDRQTNAGSERAPGEAV